MVDKWKDIIVPGELFPDLEELMPFYPDHDKVYHALDLVAPENVTVVFIGQDPYPTPGMATGLSFSIPPSVERLPPSLRSMYMELSVEGYPEYRQRTNGDLTKWATHNGVLLLNRALTVEPKKSGSHMKQWKAFTDSLISNLSAKYDRIVWILLGNKAKSVKRFIQNPERQLILEAGHPSPLNRSVPFLGCGVFRKASDYLVRFSDQRPGRDWNDWRLDLQWEDLVDGCY